MPQIGVGRARHVAFVVASARRLRQTDHADQADATNDDPSAATPDQPPWVDAAAAALAPFERMIIENALSSAQGQTVRPPSSHHRTPRSWALREYFHRFREQLKTLRADTNQPRRFLLWNRYQFAERALSSLLVDDCETYQGLPRVSRSLFRRSDSFPQERSLAAVRW